MPFQPKDVHVDGVDGGSDPVVQLAGLPHYVIEGDQVLTVFEMEFGVLGLSMGQLLVPSYNFV